MLKMHQGFAHIESKNESNALTLPEHMVKMALNFALKIGNPVVFTLDAYFAVKTVFQMAQSIYSIQLKTLQTPKYEDLQTVQALFCDNYLVRLTTITLTGLS